jgi:hypothetical protein
MKVFVVLAHPEHQSFNGAMFRPAVATFASNGQEVQSPRSSTLRRDGTTQCGPRSALFHCLKDGVNGPSLERRGISGVFRVGAGRPRSQNFNRR